MKRNAGMVGGGLVGQFAKLAKESGVSGDSWTCEACGNANYADREVCNMKKCRAPRPGTEPVQQAGGGAIIKNGWTCTMCGNENFADRMECNMKVCRAPRPGARSNQMQNPMGMMMEMMNSMMFGGKAGGKGNLEKTGAHGNLPQPAKGGEWTCVCGNKNFADREFCNLKVCRLPRPTMMFGGKGMGAARMAPMGGGCMGKGMGFGAVVPFGGAGKGACKGRAKKAGDWKCELCGNMNFADREVCNMNVCKAPRPEVILEDLGQKEPTLQLPPGREAKEGDWTCPSCGNVNFADRAFCNLKTCKAPRVL